MKEWILVVTMTLMNEPGSLNDIQMDTISGFTSKSRCDVAGKNVAHTLIRQVNKYRKQMKMTEKRGVIDFPSVHVECIQVEK